MDKWLVKGIEYDANGIECVLNELDGQGYEPWGPPMHNPNSEHTYAPQFIQYFRKKEVK